MLKNLVKDGDLGRARKLFHACVDYCVAHYVFSTSTKLMKEIIGDDKDAAYEFIKKGWLGIEARKAFSITKEELLAVARERMDSGTYVESDVGYLCSLFQFDPKQTSRPDS